MWLFNFVTRIIKIFKDTIISIIIFNSNYYYYYYWSACINYNKDQLFHCRRVTINTAMDFLIEPPSESPVVCTVPTIPSPGRPAQSGIWNTSCRYRWNKDDRPHLPGPCPTFSDKYGIYRRTRSGWACRSESCTSCIWFEILVWCMDTCRAPCSICSDPTCRPLTWYQSCRSPLRSN